MPWHLPGHDEDSTRMTDAPEDDLVARLLDQAEAALIDLDWATVRARCEAVLALEPENALALLFTQASARALASKRPDLAPSQERMLDEREAAPARRAPTPALAGTGAVLASDAPDARALSTHKEAADMAQGQAR